MNEAGIGGYFMHARGGLLTEYMGDEWFDNVDAACTEGERLGMRSWAYDENGWPSGFANGIVSSAIEFKKEGFVLGVGAKMFTIAGPVIVYGTVASVVYGLIYWVTTLF